MPRLRTLLSKGRIDAPEIDALVARASARNVEAALTWRCITETARASGAIVDEDVAASQRGRPARGATVRAEESGRGAKNTVAKSEPAPPPVEPRAQDSDEELHEASITAADRVVEGQWARLPADHCVRVFRSAYGEADHELKDVGATGFIDYDVRNGMTYVYRLAVESESEPARRLGAGLQFTVSPSELPPLVESLKIRETNEGVHLSWPMLRYGYPVALRFSHAPPWPLGRLIDAADRGGGKVIPLVNEREALDKSPSHKKAFYVVLAVSGQNAVVGKSVRFIALPDVTSLKVENFVEYVQIRWDWPTGCRSVRIGWRKGEPPSHGGDPDTAFIDVGKGEYTANGALRIPPPGRGIWYFRAFAWHDEPRTHSAGVTPGANDRFPETQKIAGRWRVSSLLLATVKKT